MLTFKRVDQQLVIEIEGGTTSSGNIIEPGSITLEHFYSSDSSSSFSDLQIDFVEFSDGTVWDKATLHSKVVGDSPSLMGVATDANIELMFESLSQSLNSMGLDNDASEIGRRQLIEPCMMMYDIQ
ncbi:hypothetical protein HC733_14055 [Pseudoalteromonas sp. S16_S37]|nr:hypothetical protein [Pseudoalteromonas sp. S16_S37]